MAEQVADLTCPAGHTVEVHWEDRQQADSWLCPECLSRMHDEETAKAVAENEGQADPQVLRVAIREAGQRATERAQVKFGKRKNGDRIFKRVGEV